MVDDAVGFSAQRLRAACLAFNAYDFGETTIEATGGWEWTTPGNEITRTLFLAPLDEADSTEKAYFTVRFAGNDSAEVVEAYALTYSGGMFGVDGEMRSLRVA